MIKKNKPIVTYEFGTFYIEGQSHREGETALCEDTFNNLWDFILSSKSSDASDVIMSVHARGGRRYIKAGRYVGTIQTRNGQVIEILPKIYKASNNQENDAETCRRIFLNMLKHFTEIKARSFQNASLDTKKGFPILEVYISNYVTAVEQLVIGGLKKNYSLIEENQVFLKGKLIVKKQITQNAFNKSRFSIRYFKYQENIPHNRIIVTTLKKLLAISHSSSNKAHISTLLNIMSDIPSCVNLEEDLRRVANIDKLFSSYDLIIKWSSQFLLNKGFTTFSGNLVNQSLLFQADKLFEDFIAYLFRKYAPSYYKTKSQNAKYFLVDRHAGRSMFQLRPDIVVESNNNMNYECIIIDTKWKAIDSTNPDRNYLVDIKDMYQLYAYGQKYRHGHYNEFGKEIIPKLILIYPYTERFTKNLPKFVYDEIRGELGLSLMVVPFNLSDISSYKEQVLSIINCLDVDTQEQPIYNI